MTRVLVKVSPEARGLGLFLSQGFPEAHRRAGALSEPSPLWREAL